MKTILSFLAVLALSVTGFAQSTAVTINRTTGQINAPTTGAVPNFTELKVGTVTITPGGYVTLAGTQTLTNKTLTTPVINGPTGIVKADVGLANVENTALSTWTGSANVEEVGNLRLPAIFNVNNEAIVIFTSIPGDAASYLSIEAGITGGAPGLRPNGALDDIDLWLWSKGTGKIRANANIVVDETRTVSAGGLATGGGDLSANRTITVTAASQAEAEAGTATGVAMTPQRTAQAIAEKAPLVFQVSASDILTDLETGNGVAYFRAPFAFTLTGVKCSVLDAPTGANIIVDINESGTSVLSTKLSIDAGEKTSVTAASQAVISDTAIASDAEILIDIDQIGSTNTGKGIIVTLIGHK